MLRLRSAPAFCVFLLCAAGAHAGQLPSDVRQNHWAAPFVARALQSGLLRVQADGRFHGDAKITRLEAALAFGKLGSALVDGTWKTGERSRPVPDSVTQVWEKTDWKSEPVRRYAFASALVRFADYVMHAVPRPAADAKLGKSIVIPEVSIKLSSKSPAYEPLTYLARNRMIKPDSALLKADASPLLGNELSHALADLATGVNDRLTDIGPNSEGAAPETGPRKP